MKTLHAQIVAKFLPTLKHYTEDITVHDKKLLDGYSGKLVFGCRTTGSTIIKLDADHYNYLLHNTNIKDIEKHLFEKYVIYVFGPLNNTRFAINDKGRIKEMSEADAITYVNKEVKSIAFYYEQERLKQNQ